MFVFFFHLMFFVFLSPKQMNANQGIVIGFFFMALAGEKGRC